MNEKRLKGYWTIGYEIEAIEGNERN